jgi:hypothetical protein
MRFLKERYDISATLDDYFVTKADAPHCGQAQRARQFIEHGLPASEHLFYQIRP